MAIKKQYLKSKPICKVTFTIPAKEATNVAVIGDFNDWNPKKSELKKLKNGTFKGSVELPKESAYEFRYLIDNNDYVNDTNADRYQWNEFAGSENGVVEV